MIKAIEEGYVQKEIQDSAYQFQKEVEEKERIIVGVNEFKIEEDIKPKILKVDPEIERIQIERLQELKKKRDNRAVKSALSTLKDKAKTNENLVPYIFDAVKVYATLGEISDVLRDVFGIYEEKIFI